MPDARKAAPLECGWRPIETAPFNGSQVLLWHRGEVRAMVLHRGDAGAMRGWGASHWQPIPLPPLVQTASAKQAAYAAARQKWHRVVWPAIERHRLEREAKDG